MKYILFNNGADSNTMAMTSSLSVLRKLALECVQWLDMNEGASRLSIYELTETEFKWENVMINERGYRNDQFAIVRHDAAQNIWQHQSDGVTFTGQEYSPENLFDEKEEFADTCDFYIAREIFYAHFNEDEVRKREETTYDWVGRPHRSTWSVDIETQAKKQIFAKWTVTVREELLNFLPKLKTTTKIDRLFVGIPYYIIKTTHNKETIVCITVIEHDEVLFSSTNISECYNYINKHYADKGKKYNAELPSYEWQYCHTIA